MKKYYSTLHFYFEQHLHLHGYDSDFREKWPNGRLHWAVYTNRGKVGAIYQYRDNYGRCGVYYDVRLEEGSYLGKASSLFEAKQLIAKKYKEIPESGTNIVSYLADPNAEFFPTPRALAGKMFGNIKKPEEICTVLEPSAGKGDLAELYIKFANKSRRYGSEFDIDSVDMIEHDTNLIALLRGKNYRVIGDDFLTFHSHKHYDLIIMNPPFSNGDEHLLKALEIQADGGQIVCLLNAETIRNPYTNRRKVLKQKLAEYGAKIEFVRDAFKHAQRRTDVEVAIVYVNIPAQHKTSTIFENLKKAQSEELHNNEPEPDAMVYGSWVEQMIQSFDFEAQLGKNLIEEYNALAPYMLDDLDASKSYIKPLISVNINGSEFQTVGTSGIERYMKALRMKYWRGLLNKPEFTSRMTSKMQQDYTAMVDKLCGYDFNLFNLQQVYYDLNAHLVDGVKESIDALFEKFSAQYSWFPECQKNIHYYNGWATNKAHKVGMKVILPINGFTSYYGWKNQKELDEYEVYGELSDLERALNYLDRGETTEKRNVSTWVKNAIAAGETVVDLTWFTAQFYKKGTCHIKFKPEAAPLIDRLNIYAARERSWLPPSYGRKHYADMSAEEKTVIDEFQGAEEYEKVMVNPSRYILEAAQMTQPLLSAAT